MGPNLIYYNKLIPKDIKKVWSFEYNGKICEVFSRPELEDGKPREGIYRLYVKRGRFVVRLCYSEELLRTYPLNINTIKEEFIYHLENYKK